MTQHYLDKSSYWKPITSTGGANTMTTLLTIDMTTPEWREFTVRMMIWSAQVKRKWHGYVHVDCVLKWLDKLPDWLVVVKPRGAAKCCICRERVRA